MHRKIRLVTLSLAIPLFLYMIGCSTSKVSSSTNPISDTQFMMGTVITISLFDTQDTSLLDTAFEHIAYLEDTLSLNQEDTLLQSVNTHAGIEPVSITSDMYHIIDKALYYSELTEGSFDISIGPLVNLWRIGFPEARLPEADEIDAILPLIDFTKVHLDESTQTVYLENEGMQLDLGGIAKGYIADSVVALLRDAGVEHGLIDLGGNIFTVGTKVDGSLWNVGIQDPFNPRGNTIGLIPLADKSIVTSGIYERNLEVDGETYHHILDPQTGYPFTNDIAGVTIISDYSMDGDALSTAIFSKGIQDGLAFVNTLEGIDALFISHDANVYLSDGLKDNFVLHNSDFTLKND